MYDAFLVPEITIEAAGESEPVELGAAAGKALLLTLAITRIVEQESLDVSIWGSADGAEWGGKSLTAFPQKFYQGVYQLLLDLRKNPEIRFLKAKWAVNRWGVGSTQPHFSFMIQLQEQSPAPVGA
ncbi:MAG: hypothetical protein HYX73_06235 [Acidobacteria bacterium]|nr:hypothetical protein [Acidobacteriota bacterium]